tara:strand:- start:23 stop:448 length:426 start_codon:yes stop_codon:yes gene_type:complete
MFNFFKKRPKKEPEKKNLKLISLCLAYEVANADSKVDSSEQKLLLEKIRDNIDIGILTEKEILNIIKQQSKERISFYDIIHDINTNLDKEEKVNILKMMWEVAYADQVLDVDEEKIIRRSAEMLGIKPSIVLQIKDQFKVE